MEKQQEITKSTEEILAEKKAKLTKAIGLMLDWQKAEKIKEALLPQLDKLTSEEIDYCLQLVRCLDNKVQLRSPFAAAAKELLATNEAKLKEMEKNIKPELVNELKSIVE
jgi:hypothetical protein